MIEGNGVVANDGEGEEVDRQRITRTERSGIGHDTTGMKWEPTKHDKGIERHGW